ncbi:MAG TPA: CvpA family protein, partial [Verrucomicrobiae bacterium]|nr:CvpA family protein [Verrucomicrobiae bacterium]
MSIWILAIVCFALFAAIGYFYGAIRALVSLVGFFTAIFLAMPLAPLAKPIVPLLKVENPLIQPLIPPVIAFFVVEAVFMGLAFYVHRMVALHYKYKTDDNTRTRWEILNQRCGASIGLVAGAGHFVLISLIIYVTGYLTVQVSPDENSSTTLAWLNKARKDMADTGIDKLVAPMDPTKPSYYQICDLLGLIYHNPALTTRLSNYPAYLTLEDQPEFQAISTDTEYLQMIQTKSELGTVVNNPKTQAILANQPLMQSITGVDLKDLKTYLETGNSPKYDEERILGRWRLDPNAILRQMKKRKSDITAAELGMVKKLATTVLVGVTLTASPDNKIVIKAPAPPAPPPVDPNAAPAAPGIDPAVAARYGLPNNRQSLGSPTTIAGNLRQRLNGGKDAGARGSAPRGPAPKAVTPIEPTIDIKTAAPAGEGTWSGDSDKYTVT